MLQSGEPPPDFALREEGAGAGRFLHADALPRPLEFKLAPRRTEDVAPPLVLGGVRGGPFHDLDAADGIGPLPRKLFRTRIQDPPLPPARPDALRPGTPA